MVVSETKTKNKVGRPPKFEITDTVLKKVRKLAADGLREWQIAEKLKIHRATLIRKKKQYSNFCDAIKKGQEDIIVDVENTLAKDARTPGMTTSQIFFLKNRCKERWGDQIDVNTNVNIELSDALNAAIERKRKVAKSRNTTES